MARWFCLALLLYVPVASAQADESTDTKEHEARMLFQLGRKAFDEGRYEDALGYFQKSHGLSGKPKLLYNVAVTHEKLDHHDKALMAYELYVDSVPEADNRALVEKRIRHLRWLQGQKRTPSPTQGPQEEAEEDDGYVPLQIVNPYGEADDEPGAPGPKSSTVDLELSTASSPDGPPSHADKKDDSSILGKWWFWAAIVAVAGGVTAGVVIATQPDDVAADPPGTNTGVTIVTLGGP